MYFGMATRMKWYRLCCVAEYCKLRWTSLSAIHPDRISGVKLIRLCLASLLPSFANQLNNNNKRKTEPLWLIVLGHTVQSRSFSFWLFGLGRSTRQDVACILNVIRVCKNRPVFLPRIYRPVFIQSAAHLSLTGILKAIPVRHYCLDFCLVLLSHNSILHLSQRSTKRGLTSILSRIVGVAEAVSANFDHNSPACITDQSLIRLRSKYDLSTICLALFMPARILRRYFILIFVYWSPS